MEGQNGLVNAPTGSGKTYSVLLAALLDFIKKNPGREQDLWNGLQIIWITPIRALSKEIEGAAERAIEGLGLNWRVASRTGDTSTKDREKIKRQPPEILITTPESLHLMLASKDNGRFFRNLQCVVCDEWHDLVGSKRGVLMELALSRLKVEVPTMRIWGISATIGNMDEAAQILFGANHELKKWAFIRASFRKKMEVEAIFPDNLETLPWSGHLGIKLLDKVVPIIKKSTSTLIFTNTRNQTEVWYQKLLDAAPELAGELAMHHGSMGRELRTWVEDALHQGSLKAVVCTSSLDLGVDFRPVETIIQVGSPKGAARFMQRAGRSGHQPGANSKIFFLPTHSLELVEAAALRQAAKDESVEKRIPYIRSFDVLTQYLVTLAVSGGFIPDEILPEIQSTFSYSSLSLDEWAWALNFITSGGDSLQVYDEFHKVVVEDGVYKVTSRRVAQRHRLSIGTIVGDPSLNVKFLSGRHIGTIEESFVAGLNPGDVFWMAGQPLEFVKIKGTTVQVQKSKKKNGKIPSWGGGRMPLSSELAAILRQKLHEHEESPDREIKFLRPLFDRQKDESIVPNDHQFLMEYYQSEEGYHLLAYPFEGRFVHEGMGALLAYRISMIEPLSFSIAMNDYGFELLCDSPIPIQVAIDSDIFSDAYLHDDIMASINSTQMARLKFRDIASISGLVFKGYPGNPIKDRHIQSSSQLFFDVFSDHEPNNLLLTEAFEEVMTFQLEEQRLRQALQRISKQEIVLKMPSKPTPFAFPIMVDRLREKVTSENLVDRISKMELSFD